MPKNTGLRMRSKSESAGGKVFSSLFSHQHFGGYDLIINVKQREVTSPSGDTSVKTDVIIMLQDLEGLTPMEMLATPFGVICLSCKTSDYLRDDYHNKVYVGCTCTRCGIGTLA